MATNTISKFKMGLSFIILCLFVVCMLSESTIRNKNDFLRNPDYVYRHAAVATDRGECSNISVDILKNGGNAVDAAITALLCVGVLNPQSSGLGGGGFMSVYMNHTKTRKYFDFRETAPACVGSFINITDGFQLNFGGESVAVPSEILGLHAAWKEFGKLSWEDLFKPVIRLAKSGYAVGSSAFYASEIERKLIVRDNLLRDSYLDGDSVRTPQTKISNPLLGDFLVKLSKLSFGDGDGDELRQIYDTMEAEVKERGGCVNRNDLESYRVKVSEPKIVQLGRLKVIVPPAPSSGPILIFILNMLEVADFKINDIDQHPVTVYLYLIKVFGLAYKLRLNLGDPEFAPSVYQFSEKIMSKEFALETFSRLDQPSHFNTGIWHEIDQMSIPESTLKAGTTHVSVIDEQSNAVSVVSSANGRFGAKFTSKEFGFVYNNQMDDFSFPSVVQNEYLLPRSKINYPEPQKRPLSSSAPLIILNENDDPIISIGAAGGSLITTAVAQVLMLHVIFGKSPQQAVDAPRIHYQSSPNIVYVESNVNKTLCEAFSAAGYNVKEIAHLKSVVQLVSKGSSEFHYLTNSYKKSGDDTSKNYEPILYAQSDKRKGGMPAGY